MNVLIFLRLSIANWLQAMVVVSGVVKLFAKLSSLMVLAYRLGYNDLTTQELIKKLTPASIVLHEITFAKQIGNYRLNKTVFPQQTPAADIETKGNVEE